MFQWRGGTGGRYHCGKRGGGPINLVPGCTYTLTTVNNSGENGLPVVTNRIAVNGNGATVSGSGRSVSSRSTARAGNCRFRT